MKTTNMCFGFITPDQRSYGNENCRVLGGDCPGFDACPFYKSIEQHESDRLAAYKRLATLPEKKQYHIALMYYRGKMPWRENDGKQ